MQPLTVLLLVSAQRTVWGLAFRPCGPGAASQLQGGGLPGAAFIRGSHLRLGPGPRAQGGFPGISAPGGVLCGCWGPEAYALLLLGKPCHSLPPP